MSDAVDEEIFETPGVSISDPFIGNSREDWMKGESAEVRELYAYGSESIQTKRNFERADNQPGKIEGGKFYSSQFGWIDTRTFEAERAPTVIKGDDLLDLLSLVAQVKASDIYLQDNEAPKIKSQGIVYSIGSAQFAADTIKSALMDSKLMDNTQLSNMTSGGSDGSVPFAVSVVVRNGTGSTKDRCRFRGNGTFTAGTEGSRDGIMVTLRRLGDMPPTLNELSVPPELRKLLFPTSGIVVCSGETNSGKTTLIGACLREIITDGSTRVVATFEDPIEFDFRAIPNRTSIVGQTDLGNALGSFNQAIKDVARRSSKITLLGEIRDEDSSAGAANLSASGQIVYATTHANSVEMTLSRMLDLIGSDAKRYALFKVLLDNTKCIVNQQLVIGKDGRLLPLQSWLGFTRDIRRKLSSVDLHDLPIAMIEIVSQYGHSMLEDIENKKGMLTEEKYQQLKAEFS